MEFFKDVLKAIPSAATNSFALAAYVMATVAWVVIALRVQRNKNLLDNLKSLPPKDRLPALRDEIGAIPLKEGLSPEQYLKSRIHLYYFLAFTILCLTIVILFLVASAKSKNSEKPELGTVKIYGKVIESSDKRLGIPKAVVYLEQEVTRSVITTDNGEFLFEIPTNNINKQATVWAVADKFVPATPIGIITQPLDKIFISLDRVKDSASTPAAGTRPRQTEKEEPDKGNGLINLPTRTSQPNISCFNSTLDLIPSRAETRPGNVVKLTTSGVQGGQNFGNVSYQWTTSSGTITSSGMNAQLDTSRLPNCAIVNVRVTAKNENGRCLARGVSKILINDISQPCLH